MFYFRKKNYLYFSSVLTGAIVLSNELKAHRISVEGASTTLMVKYDTVTVSFPSSLISVCLQNGQLIADF